MKVGLVCPYNVARGGGVQEAVLAMRKQLERYGHTAKIITSRPRGATHIDTSDMIFLGRAIDVHWPTHTTAPLSSSFSMDAIDDMLAAERFDILHFHEPWVPALGRQILARSQSVNIATFHAKVPETIVSRTLQMVVTPYLRTVLNDLHELTAVSESAAEYVSSLTDRPITLIPNGIDLTQFSSHSHVRAKSPKTILYIGRLEHRKGLRYLLQAYSMLAQDEENVELVIAGDGPERERLEYLAQDMDLRNVSFLGFVSDEVKLELLARADLFCSPAIFGESFGIVLLEAMASGLPCVAGNNSGYSEVMQGLGALSLVNPKDIPEFARRMKLLLGEPKLRALWKAWAKTYVQQYGYPKIVRRYERLYKTALRKSHVAPVGS